LQEGAAAVFTKSSTKAGSPAAGGSAKPEMRGAVSAAAGHGGPVQYPPVARSPARGHFRKDLLSDVAGSSNLARDSLPGPVRDAVAGSRGNCAFPVFCGKTALLTPKARISLGPAEKGVIQMKGAFSGGPTSVRLAVAIAPLLAIRWLLVMRNQHAAAVPG
jgi:hypothetical protein